MEEHYPFVNTPLPYAYDALEPYIDALTMHLHHDRHLQGYVNNLNVVLKDQPKLQQLTLEQLILTAGKLPDSVGIPVARNAGGVYNHRFYFNEMTSAENQRPTGALAEAINGAYGSYDAFVKEFTAAAMSVFGSGYAWLVADQRGKLRMITTANQDTPLTSPHCPILNIDVWEHAYYLLHYNKRDDYIRNWFHIIDWPGANDRYLACRSRKNP